MDIYDIITFERTMAAFTSITFVISLVSLHFAYRARLIVFDRQHVYSYMQSMKLTEVQPFTRKVWLKLAAASCAVSLIMGIVNLVYPCSDPAIIIFIATSISAVSVFLVTYPSEEAKDELLKAELAQKNGVPYEPEIERSVPMTILANINQISPVQYEGARVDYQLLRTIDDDDVPVSMSKREKMMIQFVSDHPLIDVNLFIYHIHNPNEPLVSQSTSKKFAIPVDQIAKYAKDPNMQKRAAEGAKVGISGGKKILDFAGRHVSAALNVDMPNFVPDINLPEVDLPKVNMPNIKIPDGTYDKIKEAAQSKFESQQERTESNKRKDCAYGTDGNDAGGAQSDRAKMITQIRRILILVVTIAIINLVLTVLILAVEQAFIMEITGGRGVPRGAVRWSLSSFQDVSRPPSSSSYFSSPSPPPSYYSSPSPTSPAPRPSSSSCPGYVGLDSGCCSALTAIQGSLACSNARLDVQSFRNNPSSSAAQTWTSCISTCRFIETSVSTCSGISSGGTCLESLGTNGKCYFACLKTANGTSCYSLYSDLYINCP